ncbi:MAG: hypothetical protein JWP24_1225, partial [Marmoricola sp.]|nr:hypothetical protein [Marmoricola sp.]
MPRPLRLCSLLVVVVLVVGACGSGSNVNTSSSKPATSGTTTLDITFKGNTVTPQGALVKVKAGTPLKLHIVADKPGELHVHSSPEQQIAYKAGTTDATLTLDKPGIV